MIPAMRMKAAIAWKVPALTLGLAGLFSGGALALTVETGPVPPPPAGFDGAQFVDAKGCAWLRADGAWVPRVGLDRVALCGYPPTAIAPKVIALQAASATLAAKPPPALQVKPAATALAEGIYVQVGAFARARNVTATARALEGLGLPVGRTTARVKGQVLQVVLAGPFASLAEAKAARRALCAAGYKDAYIR